MPPPINIILMGLRGSGKTTLAEELSRRLGMPWVDLDTLTPRELGYTAVRDAWDAAGEPAFRRAETAALKATLAQAGRVVALGGGTPTAPGAREVLENATSAGAAAVIYLRAQPRSLRDRLTTADNSHRPALTSGGSVLGEIEVVFAARDPVYCAIATMVVETDTLTVGAMADAVIDGLKRTGCL